MVHSWVHQTPDLLRLWNNIENLVVNRLANLVVRMAHYPDYVVGLKGHVRLIYPGRDDNLFRVLYLILLLLSVRWASV